MSEKLISSDFVHLHNHTHHSLLDGLTKIPALMDTVKTYGMSAIAITDHGTMSGVIEFYKSAIENEIKPIIGIEAYVASRSRLDKDPQKDKARYHIILLAMNFKGYQNLMKLSTIANLEGMYYKPRIDHEILEKYNEGIIVLSGCASSELGENLRVDNYKEALNIAKWYKSVFGDRYYLELQDHGHDESPSAWDVQNKINNYLEKISKELNIQKVLTSDGHYLTHEDKDSHEILLCVGTGAYLSEKNRMSLKEFDLHVTNPVEIIERWGKTHPDIIKNTKKIADRCSLNLELGKILIPTFKTPNNESEIEYLKKLVYQGLAWRYGGVDFHKKNKLTHEETKRHISKEVLERVEFELSVIEKMNFAGYFLIIQDFINWGKEKGIIFGPGRGSAAGSIISYALRITELDPLQYNLLFERFLNPDRISMPDVDIDIQDTRRDEVIAYCTEKYGTDRVANIVTFGKMAARAAVRDVARVLEVPYSEADRLSKMIPPPVQGRHIPLSVSLKKDIDLMNEYQSNPTAKIVFDYAVRLEGTIRSHGVHAAGVVIAPDEIVNYVPLEMAQKGVLATQYPMGPVEDLGLLKMDFLGLSNLTTINNALRIIKKVNNVTIDLDSLPLDDKKTFELLQRGDTTGVFQLESAGMKRYLKDLKPSAFEDIIAMVALYRPGPMQFIESFIKRKHGKEKISYLHEKFENALKETYGILVYQEQFMQISKDFAGFTGGQADTLRKAVGKKNIDLMRKVKTDFVEGALNHSSADKNLAEQFWGELEEFANYCFNKSHAACYGLIAYWTAYLKANYPVAFMAALMTSDQDNVDRLAIEIAECKHMGIKVLAPDVNESFVEFAIVPDKKQIRFGMAAVKGVGVGAVQEILRARETGKFNSIEDFAKRVSSSKFTKKAWESLIKTGGFDSFDERSKLLVNIDSILSFSSKADKDANSNQIGLFGDQESSSGIATINFVEPSVIHSEKEKLAWERELLGLYISAHPLDQYETYLSNNSLSIESITPEIDGEFVSIGGLISSARTIVTKNGTKMTFLLIEDKTGEIEVIVFSGLYEKTNNILLQDSVVLVEGKVSARDKGGNLGDEAKILAENINLITENDLLDNKTIKTRSKIKITKVPKAVTNNDFKTDLHPAITKVFIHIKSPEDHDILHKVKDLSHNNPGDSEMVLVLGVDKKSAIKMPFRVDTNPSLLGSLVKLLGEDAVVVK